MIFKKQDMGNRQTAGPFQGLQRLALSVSLSSHVAGKDVNVAGFLRPAFHFYPSEHNPQGTYIFPRLRNIL